MSSKPLIAYIPGLLPKPEPASHLGQLKRCLLEGIRRLDQSVAEAIDADPSAVELVSWTFDFYGEHRDIAADIPDIDALLEKTEATEQDIAEAVSWKRRLAVATYRAGNLMPFLIPRLANEQLELHLRDLWRYNHNEKGVADRARQLLKQSLEDAYRADRPVLLIAHSMGSVIAYDALWQMSRRESREVSIDRWLTIGSPLGQRYIQTRLLGREESGVERYPDNVRRWSNVAAFGDMTALDRRLENDFEDMLQLELVDEIRDYNTFNYCRYQGALNAHSEYGYLVNEVTARIVRDWWLEWQ